jgi:hypothetical protein
MNYKGKAQLSYIIIAPAELEAEGDRFFKHQAEWVEKTHHRAGDKALLQYTVSKSIDGTGNIIYVLTEVYETVGTIAHSQNMPVRLWRRNGL